MKRNVLVFGLLSGLIVAVFLIASSLWCYKAGNFEGNMVLGYASMLLAFSMVFVGVKNYRDKYNNGVISFGKAFQLGLYISLIASTVYVLVWLVEYYAFIPDFMDKYAAHMISKVQSSGASVTEIAAKVKDMNTMRQMYDNPIGVTMVTYMEIVPVGLVATMISALVLKRKANNDSAVAVN